jgi:hypothetical protein
VPIDQSGDQSAEGEPPADLTQPPEVQRTEGAVEGKLTVGSGQLPESTQTGQAPHQDGPALTEPLGTGNAPRDRPDWTSADTPYRMAGFILDEDARVSRLLRIYNHLLASAILMVLLLAAIAALTADAGVWVQLGSSIAGVGASGIFFAVLRRRKMRKDAEAEQLRRQRDGESTE